MIQWRLNSELRARLPVVSEAGRAEQTRLPQLDATVLRFRPWQSSEYLKKIKKEDHNKDFKRGIVLTRPR